MISVHVLRTELQVSMGSAAGEQPPPDFGGKIFNIIRQGRTYHRGMGGQLPPPPPIGIALHQTSGKLLQRQYFYGDSVETLRILRNLL